MGSLIRILGSGAEHTIAQGNIDAARIKQAAQNRSETSLAESRKIVQEANNSAAKSWASDSNRVREANNSAAQGIAAAQRAVQAARNERAAAGANVQRWVQSVQNQDRLNDMGDRMEAITYNINHSLMEATYGRAVDRIAFADMVGSTVAQAAWAGVGGGSVDDYNRTMRIRQTFQEAQEDQALNSDLINANKSLGDTLRKGVASLDNSPIMADMDYSPIMANLDVGFDIADQDFSVFTPNLDFTQYVDHKKMGMFQKVATFVGAGVATYFGGPSAGAAVLDASMSINDMQNGNFAGAQQGMQNAFTNAQAGWKTYRAGGGKDAQGNNTGGAAWGKNALSNVGASLKLW